jgi:hypothetical protein
MTKANLPTKTLIAFLWLIIIGVLLASWHTIALILSFSYSWAYSLNAGSANESSANFVFILLIGSIFYIISDIFLSRRNRRAWIVAVTALSVVSICSIGIYLYYLSSSSYSYYSAIPIISYLVPLLLIILDRKNYFEMVHRRELEKKNE